MAAVCCRCSASTVVSFCGLLQYSIHVCVQENTHFACPLPVLVSAAHYMSAEPKSSLSCTSVLNCPLMRCKANIFEFLLICFCCLFSKTKKYCSFKYCALHRIFCHKLVNIYIFIQYSDIYFHIYRTIKCFCSLSVFLVFFFFKEKSLRIYV